MLGQWVICPSNPATQQPSILYWILSSYRQFYNHIYLVTRSCIRGVGSWNGRSELVLLGYKPFKIRRKEEIWIPILQADVEDRHHSVKITSSDLFFFTIIHPNCRPNSMFGQPLYCPCSSCMFGSYSTTNPHYTHRIYYTRYCIYSIKPRSSSERDTFSSYSINR